MSGPRIGSMFSGVGGLDLAVTEALGGETVFVADVCKFDKDGTPGHYEPHRSPCSLPTPTVQDGKNDGGPSQFDRNTRPLNTEVLLLPTPNAGLADHNRGNGQPPERRRALGRQVSTADVACHEFGSSWGEYEPAIHRWESVTRPAPEPTKLNSKGNPKLSDEFDEWLMGYPAGWITDVPGVTWNEALKACGNGVVPQQGAAAIRWLLARATA